MGIAAGLLLPIRWLHAANPDWRLTALAWTLVTVGLSIGAVARIGGAPWLRHFAFPIAFFVVAVPWPSPVEHLLIQGLTSATVAATLEIVRALQIPAVQQGNLIELGAGLVGVTEACSGVRSLQSTVMLSLFLGEWHRLDAVRRGVCFVGGVAVAWVGNLLRTTTLTLLSTRGPGHAEPWHDPLGLALTVGSLVGCWIIADRVARHTVPQVAPQDAATLRPCSSLRHSALDLAPSTAMAATLLLWLACLEGAIPAWYAGREKSRPLLPAWEVVRPPDSFALNEVPLPERTRHLLRYERGEQFTWTAEDGNLWHLVYLRWPPGPAAIHAATLHTPEICLPAIGLRLEPAAPLVYPADKQLLLPFQSFRFRRSKEEGFVFFCRIGDRGGHPTPQPGQSSWRQRLESVRHGRPNQGLRVLELAVIGVDSEAAARNALRRQLSSLIVVEGSRP